MGQSLPTACFEREWVWYLENHGHRVLKRRPGSGVVKSRDEHGQRYRWILRSETGDSVLLSVAERKELRRQRRLAKKACERCFLVVRFGHLAGRAVALPVARACKMKRVSANMGGIPWDA